MHFRAEPSDQNRRLTKGQSQQKIRHGGSMRRLSSVVTILGLCFFRVATASAIEIQVSFTPLEAMIAGVQASATDFPSIANNQGVARHYRPIPNPCIGCGGSGDCPDPCTGSGNDPTCDTIWSYHGDSACRTAGENNHECQTVMTQYCFQKTLNTGFHACVTCID
jgi:hypothetical protein